MKLLVEQEANWAEYVKRRELDDCVDAVWRFLFSYINCGAVSDLRGQGV